MKNVRIGDILIEYGYITADQLDKALAYQKEHPELRIGQALQALGFVSEKQVLEALAKRLEDYPVYMADAFTVGRNPLTPKTLTSISAKQLPSYAGSAQAAAEMTFGIIKTARQNFQPFGWW